MTRERIAAVLTALLALLILWGIVQSLTRTRTGQNPSDIDFPASGQRR